MSDAKQRILIVDDHRLFVDGLSLLLAGYPEYDLVGTSGTGEEALESCTYLRPDIVLLDVDLPGIGGVEVTERLARDLPDAKVVIISAYKDPRTIAAAFSAGAKGYVPKSHAADELVGALRKVVSGRLAISPRHAIDVLGELNGRGGDDGDRIRSSLTPREWEILQLLAGGASTATIAEQLYVSPFTVRGHVRGLLSKLQVHSKMEAVSLAFRHGLVTRPPPEPRDG